jgi:DNA-directed RNA polymerase I subunit RPA49
LVSNPEISQNGNDSIEQFAIMPLPNRDAKEPNEVYNLNEILSFTQNEYDRFTLELSKKFMIATHEAILKWKEQNIYPEYVCEHLSILNSSKSNQQYKMLKCKQLAYMSYLIQLYRLNTAQLRAKSPLNAFQIPESAVNKLFSLYTVVSSDNSQGKKVRSMPRRLKDKLTCHILIMALHIDEFLTSMEGLQKDLKLSIQKLTDFYQALGCHIKVSVITIDKKKIISKKASLSLPLNEIAKGEKKKRARKL